MGWAICGAHSGGSGLLVIVSTTELPGVHLLDVEPHEDPRGTFARIWCAREAKAHGLETRVAQASLSSNRERGTLRGLHYQRPPHAEVKVVRCVRGAVFDVALDLRKQSPTFRRWVGVELSAELLQIAAAIDDERISYVRGDACTSDWWDLLGSADGTAD